MALPSVQVGQSFQQPNFQQSSSYGSEAIQRRLNDPSSAQPNQFSAAPTTYDQGAPTQQQPQQASQPPVGVGQPTVQTPVQYMQPEHAAQYQGVSASPTGQVIQNPYIPPMAPQAPQDPALLKVTNDHQRLTTKDQLDAARKDALARAEISSRTGQPPQTPHPGQTTGTTRVKPRKGAKDTPAKDNKKGPKLTKEEKKWLAGDPQLADMLAQLTAAKNEQNTQYATGTTNIRLDSRRNTADTKRQQADAMTALTDAMASSGLIRSSGYGNEQGVLNADYAQKLGDIKSARTTGLADLLNERTNYMRQSQIAQEQARTQALQRAAASQMFGTGV
jgi:hypothetical protein